MDLHTAWMVLDGEFGLKNTLCFLSSTRSGLIAPSQGLETSSWHKAISAATNPSLHGVLCMGGGLTHFPSDSLLSVNFTSYCWTSFADKERLSLGFWDVVLGSTKGSVINPMCFSREPLCVCVTGAFLALFLSWYVRLAVSLNRLSPLPDTIP